MVIIETVQIKITRKKNSKIMVRKIENVMCGMCGDRRWIGRLTYTQEESVCVCVVVVDVQGLVWYLLLILTPPTTGLGGCLFPSANEVVLGRPLMSWPPCYVS